MFTRLAEPLLRADLAEFPVVTILGSRQVGKTTLVKQIASENPDGFLWLDLERQADRNKLSNPALFLHTYSDRCVVIDEAQTIPTIFRDLRPLVDEDRRSGRFILLGSATPSLVKGVAESLAGRTSYIYMQPLSVLETACVQVADHWLSGGYPPAYLASGLRSRNRWIASFVESYIQTDINQMFGLSLSPELIRRLWQMLAHHHGNLWNAETFGRSLGVSGVTVNRYLEYLKAAFLLLVLQPWHVNMKKRLVKSPKVYLNDCGILHHFHGITDLASLHGHPICGASWEGFAILEIQKVLPEGYALYFYRTQNGAEADLLLVRGGEIRAVCDIKFSLAPKPGKGLLQSMEDLGQQHGWLITPGDDVYPVHEQVQVSGLRPFLERVKEGI